ncbi:hypothetical protein B0H10DRAFT_1366365 [Mycena sp. CBHHK59/15]|nr:hypothetical protein B0H10DRAFT_1366365 [Mycena sp. CBHHK59/15]
MITEPTGEERDVLVHEITSKDSLAGVSLKYGINMAELRRANHLWPSDPIHLRKVLYIPLDKTSRAQEFAPTPLLISTEGIEQPQDQFPSPSHPDNCDNLASVSTIRRIPASQLSFFPPPARPQQQAPSPGSPSELPPRTKHPHSRHARYITMPVSSSPPAGSPALTSILTALPIQPSTRDTIIARLSFDSAGTASSSYSDHEGHELDDVRRGASLDSVFPAGDREYGLALNTPRARARDDDAPRSHARTASASSVYAGTQYRRAGPPRTVQLEPSPIMQLPFGTLRRKSRLLNGDVDLLGLGDGEGVGETVDEDP